MSDVIKIVKDAASALFNEQYVPNLNHRQKDKTVDDFIHDIIYDFQFRPFVHDGFEVKTIVQHGGEDMGSEYYFVCSVSDNISGKIIGYVKFPGNYDSYNGVDMDINDAFEVKPVEVMVIEYQKV